MSARTPITSVSVASVDRRGNVVVTMDGQTLPVTGWADDDGVLGQDASNARFCSAGPDAYGRFWLVDADCRLARIPGLDADFEDRAGTKPARPPQRSSATPDVARDPRPPRHCPTSTGDPS